MWGGRSEEGWMGVVRKKGRNRRESVRQGRDGGGKQVQEELDQ